MHRLTPGVLLAIAALAGVGAAAAPAVGRAVPAAADTASVVLAVPGHANAHPSVATDGDAAVVTWSARGNGGTDVYAAVSDDAGATFGRPVRVNTIAGSAVTSAERPPRVAIASTGGTRTIAVLWIGAAAAPAGPRMLLSRSIDGGRTFAAPIAVSAAKAAGIRGWASLAGGRDGAFHASWLDGRDAAAGAPAGAHTHHHAAAGPPAAGAATAPRPSMRQDLYHAAIAADGSVAETRLATDVCFCCKTATLVPPAPLASATLAGDVLVAWRHIYPNSERDIAMAVRTAKTGLFAPPVRVSADRWQLQACPDDGPALAASGTGRLHAVWPSIADPAAATPEKAIFHARSTDGRTFTPRRRLDAPGSGAAHPQVAAGADGEALALWDASGEGGRRVIALPLSEPGTPLVLGPGTYPVAAPTPHGFAVAWTSGTGDASVVRVARVPLHE
ncbi:MAG: sialidase family protein [Vicinamibacteria bacterium]